MLRKDEVLSELLQLLYAMGIEPLGAMERAPNLVEKRIWHPIPKEKISCVNGAMDASAGIG
jgi:hypothetical protein